MSTIDAINLNFGFALVLLFVGLPLGGGIAILISIMRGDPSYFEEDEHH